VPPTEVRGLSGVDGSPGPHVCWATMSDAASRPRNGGRALRSRYQPRARVRMAAGLAKEPLQLVLCCAQPKSRESTVSRSVQIFEPMLALYLQLRRATYLETGSGHLRLS
jgi:hypothetical protein